MTDWAWRPQPTWTLTRAGGRSPVDLSDRALDWDVMHGCDWSPADGRWSLQTAAGHVELDNRDGAFDPGGAGSLIVAADTLTPLPITLQLGAGGATLWQGVADVHGSRRLRGDDTVTWELHGRWWQLVRRRWQWRQPGSVDVDAAELCRRILRDAAGAAASADLRSPASAWPSGVKLRDVTLDATGGVAWQQLAQTLAGLPIEDGRGLLGIAALDAASRTTAYPPGQAALAESTVDTVGSPELWGIDVAQRTWTDGAAEQLAATAAQAGTRQHAARYDLDAATASVAWTRAVPTEPQGWTVVDWWAAPAPDGSRADILRAVLRQDSDSARPSGVQWWGQRRTAAATRLIAVTPPPAVAAGRTVTPIQTPPWIAPGSPTAAHDRWVGWASEAKIRARLDYALWGDSAADVPQPNLGTRAGQLVPGSVSRYGVDGSGQPDGELDLITCLVRYRGGPRRVPTATVHGWTDSAARGRTSRLDLGSGWPAPFDIPAAPAPVPPGAVPRSGDWTELSLRYSGRRADSPRAPAALEDWWSADGRPIQVGVGVRTGWPPDVTRRMPTLIVIVSAGGITLYGTVPDNLRDVDGIEVAVGAGEQLAGAEVTRTVGGYNPGSSFWQVFLPAATREIWRAALGGATLSTPPPPSSTVTLWWRLWTPS